jgi:hypothetical protein
VRAPVQHTGAIWSKFGKVLAGEFVRPRICQVRPEAAYTWDKLRLALGDKVGYSDWPAICWQRGRGRHMAAGLWVLTITAGGKRGSG